MNKKIILITITLIIALFISVTIYKVIKNSNDKKMLVSEKYIISKAQDCINEKKCVDDVITLKSLYELGYLKRVVNPVTKEYYNESSYIKKEKDTLLFVIVD